MHGKSWKCWQGNKVLRACSENKAEGRIFLIKIADCSGAGSCEYFQDQQFRKQALTCSGNLERMKMEWYASWFNSPYYHILYKNRDDAEAKRAIDGLLTALQLPPGSHILDLACGKGRHSRYLAACGYDVTGLDISNASISFARQFEHENLAFYQHDMRQTFRSNYFDAVMNFFTSFGYFEKDRDHIRTLRHIATNLKPNGIFLLDFLNAGFVKNTLVPKEEKNVDGIEFHISRKIEGGHVYKRVEFEVNGKPQYFEERVRLFDKKTLFDMLDSVELHPEVVYGDYDLSQFDPENSNRLIILARKQKQV
jgi:SAM-dependent methyltransferase